MKPKLYILTGGLAHRCIVKRCYDKRGRKVNNVFTVLIGNDYIQPGGIIHINATRKKKML